MLVVGGLVEEQEVSLSAELYGNETSIIPDLPEDRYGHATLHWRGNLVVCGGRTKEHSPTNTCMLLPPSSHLWENQTVGNTRGQRMQAQVLKLSQGTFLLGSSSEDANTDNLLTSEFLPDTSDTWQEGPALPTAAIGGCAVTLSDHQFLVISFFGIREFDTSIDGPSSSNGWLPATTWPAMKEKRANPACASIGYVVIVAGGTKNKAPTSKTEIIDVLTRTVRGGPEMLVTRAMFSLITVGEGAARRVLALGGSSSAGHVDSVEEFTLAGIMWKKQPLSLATKRAAYGATVLLHEFACGSDLPSTSHGSIQCHDKKREVGTECSLSCLGAHGYKLDNSNENSVVCGWDSKWFTNAKCGK